MMLQSKKGTCQIALLFVFVSSTWGTGLEKNRTKIGSKEAYQNYGMHNLTVKSNATDGLKQQDGTSISNFRLLHKNKSEISNAFSKTDLNIELPSENTTPLEDVTLDIPDEIPKNTLLVHLNNDTNSDLNQKNSHKISVRKCCTSSEFFDSQLGDCIEASAKKVFTKWIYDTLSDDSKFAEINIQSGPLTNCTYNNGTPLLSGISNSSHLITKYGEIVDIFSQDLFSQSEYCLEFIGESISDAEMTLAYCPKKMRKEYNHYDYYDYYYEMDNEEDQSTQGTDSEFTVRKCCDKYDYFDELEEQCLPLSSKDGFSEVVQNLSFENGVNNVNIISSRLTSCSNDFEELTIKNIKPESYRLRYNGIIIELNTGIHYDNSKYCLERVGQENATLNLTMVYCAQIKNMIPKCCPSKHFFDLTLLECLPYSNAQGHIEDGNLLDIFEISKPDFKVKPLSSLLSCKKTFPTQENGEDIHFNTGELCAKGNCYKNQDYCIELARTPNMELRPIGFFCHSNFFIKCCPEGQILDNNGCTDKLGGSSFLLKQLSSTRKAVKSFDYRQCANANAVLLEESLAPYLQWWVGKDGALLIIESELETKQIDHYCIDDFVNFQGQVRPSAFVCAEEVDEMVPNNLGLRAYQDRDSVGKCCQRDSPDGTIHYFMLQEQKCKQSTNISSKNNSFLLDAGIANEHFQSFPDCSTESSGYHWYPLLKKDKDHAVLTSKGDLKIVSIEGKCISNEELVQSQDFCYDYYLDKDKNLQPIVFVCASKAVLEVHHEKFGIVSAFLAISCSCLLVAFIFLLTAKVRRGVVSTRKINTLAGRILLSFVGCHLIGYLALFLTQYENPLNKSETISCDILAGCIQFFNLATFCWNTSICLESLLLTIHFRISDGVRYLLHSLWAWGFPALMTTLMLVIDKYRESLPCGTIAPKIGVHHCFHSDDTARLVYFYVPIFITLIANLAFIFAAKYLRRSRLRRLEMGPRKGLASQGQCKEQVPAGGSSDKTNKEGASGMRTHQSHNTKAESIRIVLWTGGTWFLELAGFIITKYIVPQDGERWYDYLWYIPTSINALRGVGIFAIVAITPENKNRMYLHTQRFRNNMTIRFQNWGIISTSTESENSSSGGDTPTNTDRNRKMSISTVISNLSSLYDASTKSRSVSTRNSPSISAAGSETNSRMRKAPRFSMARSISQIERQSSISSMTSSADDLELENESQKRKSSLTTSSAASLPRLQEEDVVVEANQELACHSNKDVLNYSSSAV